MNLEEREPRVEQEPAGRELAEQWLNDALDRYQTAPPRPGLETRILARLQERTEQRQRRWSFALAASAAAVLCAILAMAVLNSGRNVAQPAVEVQTANPAKPVNTHPQQANIQHVHERRASVNRSRMKNADRGETHLQATEVKQDMFPAASPLSEQKTLLQAYLRQTPRQELALLADRQRLASAVPALTVPALTIEPIEIKELTPIKEIDPKGNL